MSKLGFPGMKTLDQLRSLTGSAPGTKKPYSTPGSLSGITKSFQMPSRPPSDSISMGSFANLKVTAEKLVKEQASVKTDLEMANTKLKKSMEHINALEEKLQTAINENAMLKVKQKEDAKLWNGLDSKFSSTKALCDQLTETLHYLADQVRNVEQDKKLFEDKFCASSNAFDGLNLQLNDLSVKIFSTEERLRRSEQELQELRNEKEEKEKAYTDESSRIANLIAQKDSLIKELEGAVTAEKLSLENLTSRFEELQNELTVKEDLCKCLRVTQDNLEKEKSELQSSNNDYAKSLLASSEEIKGLEDLVRCLMQKLVELDNQSVMVSNKILQLYSTFDSWYKLAQQEKELTAKRAQCQFNGLHDRFLHVTSENGALQSDNDELKNEVFKLQKGQEELMVQHAEECRLAEENVRNLESEVQVLVSRKEQLEMSSGKLEEKIEHLSETSSLSENKLRDLLLKISTLESENQDTVEKLQMKLQGKEEEVETLQKEISMHEQNADSQEKQVKQLRDSLEEKEHLYLQFEDRKNQLEDQKQEIQASLTAAEITLAEAKKQHDLMLESKQSELSKHLKEISQRNDQAINDIRRKFDLEKLEIVNLEKERVEKLVVEFEKKSEQKLAENKEESKQYLMHVQKEHASLISSMQQDHDKQVLELKARHSEELKYFQHQAEDELKEKTTSLKKEHEVQMRALRHQHEEESQKLQEELELQKSKEERQRALLQLQWKVMDGNQQEDQEVTSKKTVSSLKKRDADAKNRSQSALLRTEEGKLTKQTDPPFPGATQTQVSNILKRVEKGNTGSLMNIPKHSRKVTHREYEVETSNGQTITKRKKTKSTVMFEDPGKHKRMATPRTRAKKDPVKVIKGSDNPRPSNIGDLFSEGSLNPYADDPYAFG